MVETNYFDTTSWLWISYRIWVQPPKKKQHRCSRTIRLRKQAATHPSIVLQATDYVSIWWKRCSGGGPSTMQEFAESCWINRRVQIGKSGQQGSDGNPLLGCWDLLTGTKQGHEENDRHILWNLVGFRFLWWNLVGFRFLYVSLVLDIALHFAKILSNEEGNKGFVWLFLSGEKWAKPNNK